MKHLILISTLKNPNEILPTMSQSVPLSIHFILSQAFIGANVI